MSLGGESRPALSRAEAASGVVVVQPGDTLYAVARRTGAPVRALIDTNRLQAPYRLQAGQRLQIPTIAAARPATPANDPAPPTVAAVPRGSVESAPIASPSGASASPVISAPVAGAAPAGSPPPVMPPPPAPGTEAAIAAAAAPSLSLPSAPSAPAASPSATAPTPSTQPPSIQAPSTQPPITQPSPAASPPAPSSAVQTPPATAAAPAPPAPSPSASTPPPPVEAQPAARAGRFLWPVRGNIISSFGQKPGGLQNDGINIAAPRGAAVRAVENGVVVYAGNELKGFGNLLLLRHTDGWMSAYAHLDEILVARGATVSRGQVVAKVGQSGSVASPQLHFELRRGGRAVDPRGQLAATQTADAN